MPRVRRGEAAGASRTTRRTGGGERGRRTDGRGGERGGLAAAQGAVDARERRGGVPLDLGEPVAHGCPADGDQHGEHREHGQRVGVEPRGEQRPAPLVHALGVVLDQVPERRWRRMRASQSRGVSRDRSRGAPGRRWPRPRRRLSPAVAVSVGPHEPPDDGGERNGRSDADPRPAGTGSTRPSA